MNKTTAVIGAGISGLLLAKRLTEMGVDVVVLEKSRGLGGRMATKRVGDAIFDSGAQYLSVREEIFSDLVTMWCEQDWARDWLAGDYRRVVGRPAMTAVPKALAEGVTILREHKVTEVRRHDCGCWELDVECEGMMRAERVLFTCPVPQALAVLAAGGVKLPAKLGADLAAIDYYSCIALLVTLDGPSGVPPEGVLLADGPVRWLVDNVKKGVGQNSPAAVTIHASRGFSSANYGRAEAEITPLILEAVAPWLGAKVISTTLHRWKFSEPKTTYAERCVWLPDLGLGLAGDAFGGPHVEGAALSGLALAEAVKPFIKPR